MKDARNQEERRLASELAFDFLLARSDPLDRPLHLLRGLARLHCHTGTWTCPGLMDG